MEYRPDRSFAVECDKMDPLREYRDQFFLPTLSSGEPYIYFCGNSLGLQPRKTSEYINQELEDWARLGVEGHFHARNPWMPYHELLSEKTARLVGAKPIEVVNMNTLTVNLHLMMVSFYRPLPGRYKILIEANAFPSDRYAAASQIRFHGYNPAEALLELPLREGEKIHRVEDVELFLEERGDEIALVLLGGVNYYTGQWFDMKRITHKAKEKGCLVGYDLAHAVGNVPLELNRWGVDFAVWCSYKYLNAGPGSIAGCFVHEEHAHDETLPRFAGWWGHDKSTRFLMPEEFKPIPGAEGWQLSNPAILPLAALRASLEMIDEVGMETLREKSMLLTGYMEYLLQPLMRQGNISVITPQQPDERGCQLSIVISEKGREVYNYLTSHGIICDWREPDAIRVAPVPFYNTFQEVWDFVEILKHALDDLK